MRIHCQQCEQPTELEGLTPQPGGFGYVCQCSHINILAPVAAAAPSNAVAGELGDAPIDGHQCPKCRHVQDDNYACHRCGLVLANAADGRFADDGLDDHPLAEQMRTRWAELREDLDDSDGHRAFIRLCGEAELLEFAGLCYRRIGSTEDPRVAAFRDQVIASALARVGSIEGRATKVMTDRMRTLLVLCVAALIVLAFAIGYFFLARTGAELIDY